MNMPKNKDDRSEVLADIQQAAARHGYFLEAGKFESVRMPDKPGDKGKIGFEATVNSGDPAELSTISLVLKKEIHKKEDSYWGLPPPKEVKA